MENKHVRVMVDIEAFGHAPHGVIASIGVAVFNEVEVISTAYTPLPLRPQIALGRTVDIDTALFWAQQPAEASVDFRLDANDLRWSLHDYVRFFIEYIEHLDQPASTWWALPPSYDLYMLRSLLSMTHPTTKLFSYSEERDARTIRAYFPEAFDEDHRNGLRHHALHDAVFQAESIIRAESLLAASIA